jgi:hypothetical protein
MSVPLGKELGLRIIGPSRQPGRAGYASAKGEKA